MPMKNRETSRSTIILLKIRKKKKKKERREKKKEKERKFSTTMFFLPKIKTCFSSSFVAASCAVFAIVLGRSIWAKIVLNIFFFFFFLLSPLSGIFFREIRRFQGRKERSFRIEIREICVFAGEKCRFKRSYLIINCIKLVEEGKVKRVCEILFALFSRISFKDVTRLFASYFLVRCRCHLV